MFILIISLSSLKLHHISLLISFFLSVCVSFLSFSFHSLPLFLFHLSLPFCLSPSAQHDEFPVRLRSYCPCFCAVAAAAVQSRQIERSEANEQDYGTRRIEESQRRIAEGHNDQQNMMMIMMNDIDGIAEFTND